MSKTAVKGRVGGGAKNGAALTNEARSVGLFCGTVTLNDCKICYHFNMRGKHLNTLQAIFDTPTRAGIDFSEIESLVVALGGKVAEREGSRVIFSVGGSLFHTHRPHPKKEAKKYQVEGFREFLESLGVTPAGDKK